MSEDKNRARELVEQDARTAGKHMREVFGAENVKAVCSEDMSDWPAGDGDGVMAPITIDVRGKLTKDAARDCAALWREATRR